MLLLELFQFCHPVLVPSDLFRQHVVAAFEYEAALLEFFHGFFFKWKMKKKY
jgi:hypothetical protein